MWFSDFGKRAIFCISQRSDYNGHRNVLPLRCPLLPPNATPNASPFARGHAQRGARTVPGHREQVSAKTTAQERKHSPQIAEHHEVAIEFIDIVEGGRSRKSDQLVMASPCRVESMPRIWCDKACARDRSLSAHERKQTTRNTAFELYRCGFNVIRVS